MVVPRSPILVQRLEHIVGTITVVAVGRRVRSGSALPVTTVHHRFEGAHAAVGILPVVSTIQEAGEHVETVTGALVYVVHIRLAGVTIHIGVVVLVLISLDTGQIRDLGSHTESDRSVVRYTESTFLHIATVFGLDQDHTVGSLRTVDGGRRCILQHGDRFYVIGVEQRQGRDGHVVHQDQRVGTTVDGGVRTTDTEGRGSPPLTVGHADRKSRSRTLQCTSQVRYRTAVHCFLYVHRCHRGRDTLFRLYTVTYDNHVVKHLGVLAERYGYRCSRLNVYHFRFVPHERHLNLRLSGGKGEGKFTVEVRRCSNTFYTGYSDIGSRNGLLRLSVDDLSLDCLSPRDYREQTED